MGDSLLARGCAHYAAGHLADAEAAFRALGAAEPGNSVALANLGGVLNEQHRYAEGEAACRQALARCRDNPSAWSNLGVALHAGQRRDEAVAAYAEALRRRQNDANTLTNLGVALTEQGRLAMALQVHDAALAVAPTDADVRCNRALALLTAGQLARGFAENEWRWQTRSMLPHGIPGPCWQGDDPAGRRVLLHCEGGFGDTLQFVRYVPLLAARGAVVVLRVQQALVRLIGRMPWAGEVVSEADPLPRFDVRCPLLSLPYHFGTTLETVPADVPYLAVDQERAAAWRAGLAGEGLKVGLVWAGASRPGMAVAHAMDQRRSLPLAAFAPLAVIPGVRLVSLQAGETRCEARPPGMALVDPMGACVDFDDTAAIVAGLDLVISVDTAVAHLAGALGKPVWLLSRYDACWRWMHDRRDSPWYPSMRIYHQPAPAAWEPVLEELAADLARAAARWDAEGVPPPPHPSSSFAAATAK
jgi:Flp pilus assembly protein TadD